MSTASENVETVQRYLKAIEDGTDFEALASFFTPDIIQREFPNQLVRQGAVRGLEDLRQAALRGRDVVASQRYEIHNVVASGDSVALEVTWRATLKIAVGSIQAGNEMSAHFGVFFQLRGGKIARQHNYDCFEPF
jgi:ketosteroid isomerase-like protein